MRGRRNTRATAVRSQGRSLTPRLWPVPGKEAEPVVHLGVQSTFGTLREVYLAPWAAERVSLAMRMPAMLEEAGEPNSPSFEKRKKSKKKKQALHPFFLSR